MAEQTPPYPRVRWHNSLIFQVASLCVVLLFCLLGSVYVITRYYFHEVVQEMEDQAQNMADNVVLQLQDNPEAKLGDVGAKMMTLYPGNELDIQPYEGAGGVNEFTIEKAENGQLKKVLKFVIKSPGRTPLLLTARIPFVAQTEIVRAFKNTYLEMLTAVFLVALGLMVYFIARILRPLTTLSRSCARIGSGHIEDLVTQRSSGEILALEHTFNRMVAALREKEVVEANLRQAQRLSAIGNLAAGVAHDVRNPLNAIKLLSSHAIDTLGEAPETAGTIRQLQTIRKEVDRLEDIVSGFLSLAKERELKPELTRIDLVLQECVRLVQKDAEARGIRLAAELRAGDTALMVDAKQLIRAILNVLINAMDACGSAGRVRLFSRVTEQSCEIEIRDDGPGMSREVSERVFDPYFTTKTTGTGLGLSITRGIVEEHGGRITLSSSEGEGCQVLIVLPLRTEANPGPESKR